MVSKNSNIGELFEFDTQDVGINFVEELMSKLAMAGHHYLLRPETWSQFSIIHLEVLTNLLLCS